MINGVTGTKAMLDSAVNLRCVDLETGTILWEHTKVGRYHAAIIRLGDDKLLMLDDNGFLTLFEDNPKEYKELARSKVCGTTWAHPALVDGRLYLRDNKNLICLDMPK
jgi:outer membrane protein assembly factor BamB